MRTMEESLQKVKSMVAFYDREISKSDRKIELLTKTEEFEEAKKEDWNRKDLLMSQLDFSNMKTAMEFYLEHNLQEA